MQPALEEWYIKYTCDLAGNWEAFAAYVGTDITTSDDGLWQPLADERIRAVMPMGPEGAWLFGERGLAAVDRPVLVISPTEDKVDPHTIVTHIFERIGNPEKVMISFIGKEHMMVIRSDSAERIIHFATAFFGYYLQGKDDYAAYFSEDFVKQYDDLYWGVYKE